jgi:hypothetical protein
MQKVVVMKSILFLFAFIVGVTARAESGDTKGVLLAKPRITKEQAIQIARDFVEDPQANFSVSLEVNRAGRWFPAYRLESYPYSVYIDASTGEVKSAWWRARKFKINKEPRPEVPFPMGKAVPIAREFLRRKFPGFDDSFELLWQRQDEVIQTYEIQFGKTSNGIWLWRGANVEVSTKTGEVVRFSGFYYAPAISLEPGIPSEKAIEIAKSLTAKPVLRAEARLEIVTDSIGEHRLEYRVVLRHGERVNIISGGKREVESIHTTLFLDAQEGKFSMMFVPLGGKPNLKQEIPPEPGVVFNGYGIDLMTPPVVRTGGVLISDKLFEALGGDMDFDKASGKIVLSKGNDPAMLFVGKKDAELNGQAITLPVAPEFTKGKLFIPATFVESVLGMKVKWDEEKYTLTINAPNVPGAAKPDSG